MGLPPCRRQDQGKGVLIFMKASIIRLFLKLKPQPKEMAWVAMTFVIFFVVSLGVNHFRSNPMSIFGGKTPVAKNHDENGEKTEKWKYCNLADMDSFKAAGDILILDARPGLFHKYGHIPGALSLPAQTKELGTEAGKILSGVPKSRTVVIYCADKQCENAEAVAEQVWHNGYGNIHIFSEAGWSGLKAAGLLKNNRNHIINHEITSF
jgi:rhodanese-related sulfurtransferase